MREYKISVIVPVYNGEQWIERCLRALLDQTIFEKIEAIFVENGSVDNSRAILEAYCEKYENWKCISLAEKGVSNARNNGLEVARGEYIAFVDSDDTIAPQYFEDLLKAMDGDTDVVAGGYTAVYDSGRAVRHAVAEECTFFGQQALIAFLKEEQMDPCVWGKLFARRAIENVRFDPDLIVSEDRWFLFQMFQAGCRIKCIPTGEYYYIMNDESVCRKEFSEKNWQALRVYERIAAQTAEADPPVKMAAESAYIDMECRVLGELELFKARGKYPKEYRALLNDIRSYSVCAKRKSSSRKHFVAFLLMRISPAIYVFIKNNLKMQYHG